MLLVCAADDFGKLRKMQEFSFFKNNMSQAKNKIFGVNSGGLDGFVIICTSI